MLIEINSIPASKSFFNRALIVKSYAPALINLEGQSDAQDVLKMQRALTDLSNGQSEFDCGEGGTVFRFFVLRLSRQPGEYIVRASPRLLSRPHGELLQILMEFGVQVETHADHWKLTTSGWQSKGPKNLTVSTDNSSQFLSAILLNLWGLDFDVQLNTSKTFVSRGYFEMTNLICKVAGMNIATTPSGFSVSRQQKPTLTNFIVEPDMSCAFAIAALGVVKGSMLIKDFPISSSQPDYSFVEILKELSVTIKQTDQGLEIFRSGELKGIKIDLCDRPDLFPVLAVICARAVGQSTLFGAHHLQFKESNRIESTAQLLRLLKVKFEKTNEGIEIFGQGLTTDWHSKERRDFDPDQDHRLAMAAAVANAWGANIKILKPNVVDKSFPNFWQLFRELQ